MATSGPGMATTKRGGHRLEHDGYTYRRDNVKGQKTYWKCMQDRQGCRGRLTLHDATFQVTVEHNHERMSLETSSQQQRSPTVNRSREQRPVTSSGQQGQPLPSPVTSSGQQGQPLPLPVTSNGSQGAGQPGPASQNQPLRSRYQRTQERG